MNKKEIGSKTAKGGFLNETNVCEKFLNYKNDLDASSWLNIMGYESKKIQNLTAIQIPPQINLEKALFLGVSKKGFDDSKKYKKADIQIRIEILIDNILHVENLSLKKANKNAGFNQVDKRSVDTYQSMWNFNEQIAQILKKFTGEILPKQYLITKELESIRDKRRIFLDEIKKEDFDKLINFFENNKMLIITDILRGRGSLSAEWLLVTQNFDNAKTSWVLKDINSVCNFYAQGDVKISPKGSLKIGRVTMQRKGGTPDPTSLQFKINPLELFAI